MPSSAVINLAIGLTFVFGATAALSSVITELVARFLGLRGIYLLRGLRELLDGGSNGPSTVLADAVTDYGRLQDIVRRGQDATAQAATAQAATAPAATAQGTTAPAAPAQDTPAQGAVAAAAAGPVGLQPARGTGPAGQGASGPPGDVQQTEAARGPAPVWFSAVGALLGSPILRSQGMVGQISSRQLTLEPAGRPGQLATMKATAGGLWRQSRSLPSYISSESFADAIVDLLVPDASGETTMSTVERSVNALPDWMPTLKASLQALVKNAGNDIGAFRTLAQNWYDDHMSRVSGWYKRHVAKITLLVGAILIVLLNVNTLLIGRALYTDPALSAAVTSVAAKGTSCPADQSQQGCLARLETQLSTATAAGLPIGWATIPACVPAAARCSWLEQRGILNRSGSSAGGIALIILGLLMTITALVPGARFWFGLLSKIGSLRSTGPRPAAQSS